LRRLALQAAVLVWAVSATGTSPAQMVDIPIDERAQVRAYGLWWMTHQNRVPLNTTFARADEAYDAGDLARAERNYTRMARYGDKYAQFRLGLIAKQDGRPEEAWAWFRLTAEGAEHTQFVDYAGWVWADLDEAQRARAEAELRSLSQEFSDLALAYRMKRIFREQLKMSTGSRLGFTDGLPLQIYSPGITGLTTQELYSTIRMGLNFSQDLIENYGIVVLREFEVFEPGEEPENGSEPTEDSETDQR